MHKIYYIANARMPTEKAHGFQIAKMCESFSRKGADVTLIVPRRINHIDKKTFEFYGLESGFKIKRMPTLDLVFLGRLGFLIQQLSFSLFLRFFLKIPDDVIVYSRDLTSVALLPEKNPVFVEIHDEVRQNFPNRRALERADGIISTNFIKRDWILEEFGVLPEKIKVFPNGVDLSRFSELPPKDKIRRMLNLPRDKKLIAYMGRFKTMGEEKGIETILRTLGSLPPKVDAVFIGGTAEEIKSYKKRAEEFGVNERTEWIEFRPRSEIPLYLKAMDILLMPFPKTRHYEYAMSPIKMFEYMASKRPIVASDMPSVREVLDDESALLTKPGSSDELKESILQLLNNEELYHKLARNAFTRVRELDWVKRASGILDFIDERK